MRQVAKWAVWEMRAKKQRELLMLKWKDFYKLADFTVSHSPSPLLTHSPSSNSANLIYPIFLGCNVPPLPPRLIVPLRLNFNNSIVFLRKKSTWCRWYFKHICFCVICSEHKYQFSNFTVVSDKLKHHQLFFS